jgi:hypothetical protein
MLNPHALDAYEAAGIWWYLVRTWQIEHDEIEYSDFMDGLTYGCRVEVMGRWRGMHWEGEIVPEGDRLVFFVKGSKERRRSFKELEEQIGAALPNYVAKLRPAQKTPVRIRVSPLAC